MTKSSKMLLRIGIILYIIIEAISVLRYVDIDGIEKITRIGNLWVPITTIILLAYIWDRGDDKLAKIGILFVVANMTMSLLRIFGVTPTSYQPDNMMYKITSSISALTSGGVQICGMLALFSMIPNINSKNEILKTLAVICYVIYMGLNLIEGLVDVDKVKWIAATQSLFVSASSIFEYGFIVAYLLSKKIDEVADLKEEFTALQQTTVAPQQIPQQQMPPQVQQPVPMQPGAIAAVPAQPAPIAAVPAQPGAIAAVPAVPQQQVQQNQ